MSIPHPELEPFARRNRQLQPQPNEFAVQEAMLNPSLAAPVKFDQFVDLSPNSAYWNTQANLFQAMQVSPDVVRPVVSEDMNEIIMDDVGFLVDEDGRPVSNVRPLAAMPRKQREVRKAWHTATQSGPPPPPPRTQQQQQQQDAPDNQTTSNEESEVEVEVPPKTSLQQAMNRVKGAAYDLAHFAELPGKNAGEKLRYACTRDNRAGTLWGLLFVTILVICLIVLVALLIKHAVDNGKRSARVGNFRRMRFPFSRRTRFARRSLPLVEITS